MNKEKIANFIETMNAYDGFSDVNYPAVKFWDLDLNELKEEDFSYYCLFNVTRQAIVSKIETVKDFMSLIQHLEDNYSDLNAEDYPEYTKGDFEFQSRLVGFLACAHFNHSWSVIPIIELYGRDAETIVTAITLVS